MHWITHNPFGLFNMPLQGLDVLHPACSVLQYVACLSVDKPWLALLPTSAISSVQLKEMVRKQAAHDVDPPLSEAASYIKNEMSKEGYRHLLAVGKASHDLPSHNITLLLCTCVAVISGCLCLRCTSMCSHPCPVLRSLFGICLIVAVLVSPMCLDATSQ